MIHLRPYQVETLERARSAYRSGAKRVILQASTGAGKTAMASRVVKNATEAGRRVLYVVHRDEILRQTAAVLASPTLLTAGGKALPIPPGTVTLASIQTLARREIPEHDLLIVDEAHVNYEQQKRIQAACPNAKALLLTATPVRTDGKPLADIADAIAEGPAMAWLVEQGYLVPARFYGAPSPDMHDVPVRRGEFDAVKMEEAYRATRLVGSVPDAWRKHAAGRRTILFAAGVNHSLDCVKALTMAGVRALHVDGNSSALDRATAFEALRDHSIDVLCNVGLAIEGLDLPAIECVYWARATASLAIYLQGTGRGMRPSPGKTDLVVIDGGGNVYRHGLPEQARSWTLEGKVRTPREVQLRTCAQCYAVGEWAGACPRCGTVPEPGQRGSVQTVGGDLVRITAAELERRARASSRETPPRPCPPWAMSAQEVWDRLERKRQREGYALGDGGPWSGWTASMWRRIQGR